MTNRTQPKNQRLNKILSSAGLTSRRKADEWIKDGRVEVNKVLIIEPGSQAKWGLDSIKVDGQEIPKPSPRIYLMLNKPFGYMCTLSDPQGRPVVTDLLKDIPQRIYPVGRLDFDSLGLILLTNDGEWSHRMTHPSYRIPRTYKVTIEGDISDRAIKIITKGVDLEDGPSGPSKVTLLKRTDRQSLLRMTIRMGRSRQIRRMFDVVGFRVVHLMRTGFGNLVLGDLKVGEYRYLETEEVDSMKTLAGPL